MESAAAGEGEIAVADAQRLPAVVLEGDAYRREESSQILRVPFPRVSNDFEADAGGRGLGDVLASRCERRARGGFEDLLGCAGLEGKDRKYGGNWTHHRVLSFRAWESRECDAG